MMISRKTDYALRAVFELARRSGRGPTKILEIAQEQAIPPRFLEVILNQLKHAGFLDSRRGSDGGYYLTRRPEQISVGEVIRTTQADASGNSCRGARSRERCPRYANCVFVSLWDKVHDAIARVYDGTTFQDLLAEDARMRGSASAYSI